MKCQSIVQFGLEGLQWGERPDLAPGPGQVRVRINAASLNYRDLMMVLGQYNPRQPLPLVPGSDGAGVIDALGEGVTEWKVGDRVMGCFAPYFQGGAISKDKIGRTLGGPLDGTFAEQVVLPATGIVRTPDTLTDEQAACLPCAYVTAWNAVIEQGQVQAGQTVLVQGTGGVSIAALQIARAAGAHVVVTSSSDEKLARAKALGAEQTINYKTTPEWGKAAKADIVIEVGGAATLEQSLRAVVPGGRIMIIGVLSGAKSQVLLTSVLMQNVRLQGVLVGSRDTFQALLRAVPTPIVDRTFALSDGRTALAHLQSGGHFGKIVLVR